MTTSGLITSGVVADIGVVTLDRNVDTRVGEIGGCGVTAILGASIVVITESSRLWSVYAALFRVTSIDGTCVVIVAGGADINRSENTLSGLVVGMVGPVANILGTVVAVVTISVNLTSRRRTQ